MAIQKMAFLKIVGSVEDMHKVLQSLILCEKLHFDFEHADVYDNSYIIHEFEAVMAGPPEYVHEDIDEIDALCVQMEKDLDTLSSGLGLTARIDKGGFADGEYSIHDAQEALDKLNEALLPQIGKIAEKRATVQQYEQFKAKMSHVNSKNLDFGRLAELNYFNYEIGSLSKESRYKLRQNYENISSVVMNIGRIKDPQEDIQIIIFPRQFQEETLKLLKSLNWVKLDIPDGIIGTVSQMIKEAEEKIRLLSKEIEEATATLLAEADAIKNLIDKIYTSIKLEKKILSLEREIDFGESTFVLNAWIKKDDREEVKNTLAIFKDRLIIEEKNAHETERQVIVPTQFKNNFFIKPFESIVRLYGLPSYNEVDPTPFFALTFCLMFGMMFGDIGQGLIYFIMGLCMRKRNRIAGQILTRLGLSSVMFGFVYGSFFGLEKQELPWLPSMIGRTLDPKNIPGILIAGIILGIVVLTISYIMGTVNAFQRRDVGEGVLSRNGIAGYIFYLSLILLLVSISGIVAIPTAFIYVSLFLSLAAMTLKIPLNNLLLRQRPLLRESLGEYLTESFFEAVETILTALSNAISFVRIGAFALNHAGLFLAFLALSEMMPNFALKVFILILGNLLILTLEGLVVFIQGLRLEYDEMFSKYFQGGGVAFEIAKISD